MTKNNIQFSCCGFQTSTDNYVTSNTCTGSTTSTIPACASTLQSFVKNNFSKMYYAVFAALALELLALTNAITMICSGYASPDEEERRKHRKSGIRLDDMTADTPTTLVGSEEYKYFPSHEDQSNRNNRYDSYDMYRHNNHSNTYSDTYNGHTINNNRHGNGNGTYY